MKKSIGIKTIAFPHPVHVIGTYDKYGNPNIMTAAWSGICCSQPAYIYVSLRKATYTYNNIAEKEAFTINIPDEKHIKEADYAGIFSGREHNKFEELHLTPVNSENINAPYIKEFPVIIECKLVKTVELGLHTQFIGEIVDVKAEECVLTDDNKLVIEKIKPVLWAPDRHYYSFGNSLGKAFSIGKELKKD